MKKLLLLLVLLSLKGFSQTTTLTFSNLSTDLNRPGGGAEQWTAGQNTVNIPTAGVNTQRLDAYYRFSWTDIQSYNASGPGLNMDFTNFDIQIQDAIRKRQGFSFGVMLNCCSGPSVGGANLVYPLALHNLMQAEAHKDWNNGGGWYENPNSLNWQAWVKALHTQLNAHIQTGSYQGVLYKNVVKRIDIRIAGDFGEQAVLNNAPDALSRPTGASLDTLANAVVLSYPDIYCTSLIGAFAAGVYGFTPAASGAYFLQLRNNAGPTGWRWDSWGWTDGIYHSALENNTNVVGGYHFDTAIMNRYKYAPVGGEPADLGMAGNFADLPVRVAQYHAQSFGNGNLDNQANNTTTANNFRAASKLAGYRWTLTGGSMTTSPALGGTCNISINWSNGNGTPAYDNWRIVYEWRSGTTLLQRDTATLNLKGQFSTIANNENFTMRTVPAGTADLYMKIVDPTGYRPPMPLFITTAQGADGAYLIRSGITITSSGAVANAGNNQSITITSATLNGSGSIGATSYLWTRLSGPNTPTIVTPTAVSTSVTGLITGTYVFQLAINGGSSGQLISPVTVVVNAPPVSANAGNNQTITLPTSTVTLSGSGSTGAVSYLWTNVSGPNTPTITTPLTVGTTVTGLIAGTYVFNLSINSGASNSNTTVIVLPAPSPTANAGPSRTITLPVSSVLLDGSGSTGTLAGITWSQVSGPAIATLNTPNSITCTASALVVGTYVFQLALFGGSSDTMAVTVNQALPPPVLSFTTIFTTQTPNVGAGNNNNGTGLEVGVKFRSVSNGYITGIRFYKVFGMSGVHVGELYNILGTRLGAATFTVESSTGWQTIQFATPIPVTAGTTYVAAVFSYDETYVGTPYYFNSAVVNSPLTALAQGFDGNNGVYKYGASPVYPDQYAGNSPNYWVDAVFSLTNPGTIPTRSNHRIYFKMRP